TDYLCDELTPSSLNYSGQSVTNGSNDIEDDVMLGASRRLRMTVKRVLKILSEIVEHHHRHDPKELLKQKDDLAIELHDECKRSDKLTSELIDKQSMIQS